MRKAKSRELRAAALAEMIKLVSLTPGPVRFLSLYRLILQSLGREEEECGGDIYLSAFFMARSGIVTCNTYSDGEMRIGAETTLTAAHPLIDYVWNEPGFAEDDEAA